MENYNGATVEQIMEHDLMSEPVVSHYENPSRMAVCMQCCRPTHAGVNREATKKVSYYFGLTSHHKLNLCDNCADRKVRHYKHEGIMMRTGFYK